MKITRKSMLYDISNMAYLIADTGEENRHTLHRVRDICEDGNIDRVNRVLALAFSNVLTVLLPVIKQPRGGKSSSRPSEDFEICFRDDGIMKYHLTHERLFNIKETVREYMLCMVLADWLAVTLPEAADVWRFRAGKAMENLAETVTALTASSFTGGLRRRLSPF